MIKGELKGNNSKVVLVDEQLGTAIPWEDVNEISEEEIEPDQPISASNFYGECNLNMSTGYADLERDYYKLVKSDYHSPNPIYVPKHIARRKKW